MAWTKSRIITLTNGFYLRVEQGEEGHLIRALEMGGPAELAGLKDGDRIIRVNGTFVDNMQHNQVVDMVRKSGMMVTFHVIGEETYKQAKANGVRMALAHTGQNQPTMNGVSAPAPKPKLCYLQKSSSGFGFSLRSIKSEQGTFMIDVISGGVADQAGVKVGDRVVEINGENVDRVTHDQIVQKGGASPLLYWEEMKTSLPIHPESQPESRPAPIPAPAVPTPPPAVPTPAPAVPTPSPAVPTPAPAVPTPAPAVPTPAPADVKHKPKLCRLGKTAAGFGFHLNGIQGVHGQYIKEVVKGGAADRSGLEDEDIVVEVNGVNVEVSTHEEVVNLIHESGVTLLLLVVERTTYNHLKAQGISITPLLHKEPSTDIPTPACTQEEERKEHCPDTGNDKETENPSTPSHSRTSSSSSSSSSSAASEEEIL